MTRIMKLHTYIGHDWQMTPIDFQITGSKVKVTWLLSLDNDATDVVNKDDLNTQKLYKMIPVKSKSSDVRDILAETNKGENCGSAPAQSTSIDIKLAQQPHESRLQEPQSRTNLPLHLLLTPPPLLPDSKSQHR
ncbi:hypothetical protein DPMN_078955 [Dreissena polymorpha]|uniref:Uncharacterized protein n=1 Tax=Dreissena polymorpha TaxID=45954 RepID=A0A9D3YTJ1_DREPO|nr:hypothetical protein DPMN_078955 [Dreissena polymorpha]